MIQNNTPGPCGYSLPDTIKMADRFAFHAAGYGITDPGDLNYFLTQLGEHLTVQFGKLENTSSLESYKQRLARVGATAAQAFIQNDYWDKCAALGPYAGPSAEEALAQKGAQAFSRSFHGYRQGGRIPASEVLDLLTWIQTALSVRILFAENPDLACSVGSKHAAE